MTAQDTQAERRQAFAQRLADITTGHLLTTLIAIGHRTGLFEALAAGPASADEVAARAGLNPRYVREWLGGTVTGGIVDYRRDGARYSLPAAHAALLTGPGSSNIGPTASMLGRLAELVPQVEHAVRDGDGVPWSEYGRVSGGDVGENLRRVYDDLLLDHFLPAVPGLVDRLDAGARVLDVGCGTGRAVTLMAERFPRSEFTGIDVAHGAVDAANAERDARGLSNARFAVADAGELPAPQEGHDVVFAFDAVHDLPDPERALRRIRAALADDGELVMIDTAFHTDVADNIGNPYAPGAYAMSLLFCVPTARAQGGEGLGAMWGLERARELLAEAGFSDVAEFASPRPQNCVIRARPRRR